MSGKYFCEISIFTSSGELGFRRTCNTKRAAEELADWIHQQYAETASAEVLTLKLSCRKNQVPRVVSFCTRDVCAISTIIGVDAEDFGEEADFKIEPGFRDTSREIGEPFTVSDEREEAPVAKYR